MKNRFLNILVCLLVLSCNDDDKTEVMQQAYEPIPYQLQIPATLEQKLIAPVIPATNPLTVEGVALGKRLFFDKFLSKDNTVSCASCHSPQSAFTDNDQFSDGFNGDLGTRNSMPLFNLAWNFDEKFFWDGHKFSLEQQALEPVIQANEMGNSSWEEVENRLQNHPEYPELFNRAFGTTAITRTLATQAIAQFERTLVSGNSKFDKYTLGEVTLTSEELDGLDIFMNEQRGDCFHCHGNPNNPLWTDNNFHNNGLDETFTDLGLGAVTGDPADNGKFRSASLRNLIYTAPYMHDGRFATLDDVINHYSEGLKNSPTVDALMKKVDQGGVQLNTQDKANLKAFLLTLTDPSFVNNPANQFP